MPRPVERLIRKSSWMVVSWLFLIAIALAGCDDPPTTGPPNPPAPAAGPTPCAPGELTRPDGTCQPAGLPPDMPCPPGELLLDDGITCQPAGLPPDMPCPPGELLLDDGTCQKAGVPPSACAAGFLPDGKEGCEPILPADPCPEGLMAVPGDTTCHEVAPCGSGPWGNIPIEANTQFVDKSYAGGDSDGTQAKPWTTLQKGVAAAANGAIVAVAAGSYPEDVLIQGKAVRLWGRCPAMVEVAGTGVMLGAIQVLKKAANGTEIHSIAVTGANLGIGVSGASDVVIEGAWIHGAGNYGLDLEDALGPTSAVVKGSLIEQNHYVGVFVGGSDATIEATLVRSTLPDAQGKTGRGIGIQPGLATKARADVTARACLVEQNHEAGVYVAGSDMTIEATVVRSTFVNAQGNGRGIAIEDDLSTKARANVTVRACLVEQNHAVGVSVFGSDAAIEATVVRSTSPGVLEIGYGIDVQDNSATDARANVTVRACLVEQNHRAGVRVLGSDAAIEATVVRSNLSGAPGQLGGGIIILNHPSTGARASATVRACLVEQNHQLGMFVEGSDATIEATLVRSTVSDAQGTNGRGINIQQDVETMARANVTVRACLVDQNQGVGVFVGGADAAIEATVVRSTLPNSLGGGRGITVENSSATMARANVTVRACLVDQNREIGVFVVGSDATIEASVIRATMLDTLDKVATGVAIQNDPDTTERADVTVRACLVEQNNHSGLLVAGSDATIEATVVRETLPGALGELGRGISIQSDLHTKARASAIVRACIVEQNRDVGVFVAGSDATIEATVVRETLPDGLGKSGRGINLQDDSDIKERSSAAVRACVVEQNHDVGVFVLRSDVAIVDSVVRDTAPNSDGTFGDGISALKANVTTQSVEVTGNARAGVSSFGGQVVMTGGVITCNGFDLEGEPFDDTPFSFDGSTGWQCSDKPPAECTELGDCHVETIGIEAPSELPPVDPLPQPDPLEP